MKEIGCIASRTHPLTMDSVTLKRYRALLELFHFRWPDWDARTMPVKKAANMAPNFCVESSSLDFVIVFLVHVFFERKWFSGFWCVSVWEPKATVYKTNHFGDDFSITVDHKTNGNTYGKHMNTHIYIWIYVLVRIFFGFEKIFSNPKSYGPSCDPIFLVHTDVFECWIVLQKLLQRKVRNSSMGMLDHAC